MGWGVKYPEPPERHNPHCPVCGEECDTVFINWLGEVVGCDSCLTDMDAYDWEEQERI